MSDNERIERLELEVEVLRANNKGLKDKIEELNRINISNSQIIANLKNRIKSVDEIYERELPLIDLGEGHKVINISYLSKKEREEVMNKRNCLLVQRATYQEILSLLEHFKFKRC